MRYIQSVLILSALLFPVYASVPEIGVLVLNEKSDCPGEDILNVINEEFASSGRFVIADIAGTELLDVSSDSLIIVLRTLAADKQIDVFFAIEVLPEQIDDRTFYRNDSVIVERNISVELMGRFYSSNGALIGSTSEEQTYIETSSVLIDRKQMILDCAESMAGKAISELFPVEVNFVVQETSPVHIPAGTDQGLENGMVMYVLATTSGMPESESDYEQLQSRALLQITSIGPGESEGHLLSGSLATGGNVVAIEHGAPAHIGVSCLLMKPSVITGDSLPDDYEVPDLLQRYRISVSSAKWGLSFNGAFVFDWMKHISALGIEFLLGSRIPLMSPHLALRIAAGGEMTFLMQETVYDSLTSTSALAMTGLADIDLEYMFSSHLGINIGCEGMYGFGGDSWGAVTNPAGEVIEVTGDELYFSQYRYNGFSVHAGLIYMMY